ncbi:hypothetical protein [Prevotella koreensis]
MAEIAINLKGQDNLTQTVKNAKQAVDNLKNSSTELGKCSKEFDKISNAGRPLKSELRQLQALMANMNLKGLSNTDEFTKIAIRAGEIKDAMSDASAAVSRFASDTFKLDAAIQGLQGITAATTIATGAMGLFGRENEKVQQMILKVQSAMAILNGIQSIANVLNKDSALMQRIKQIRMAASTKTTVADTIATTANTVAEKVNTGAIVANTVAQKAWNVSKAIGKALFGDFTGLLLVGVGVMTAYALSTDDASKEQKEMNDAVNEAADAQKNYKKIMADTYASLMSNYISLKNEWESLKTTHEKKQWIIENKNKLNDLEESVNNVKDAEKVFNGNTSAVVDSFIRRAKAAARLAELTDLYRKQMELIDKRNENLTAINSNSAKNRTGITAQKGAEIPQGAGNFDSKYGKINTQGKWVFSEEGAKNWNFGVGENSESVKKIDKQIESNNAQINKVASAIQEDVKNRHNLTNNSNSNKINNSANSHSRRIQDVKFAPNSLDDLEAQLNDAKKKLTSGLFKNKETEESVQNLIKNLEKEINEKKIQLGIELSDEAKAAIIKQKENAKKLEEANEDYAKIKPYSNNIGSFDAAIKTNEEANGFKVTNQGRLDEISREMNYNDNLIAQLYELKNIYQELGAEGVNGLGNVNEQIKKLILKQNDLSKTAQELNQNKINWENQQNAMQSTAEIAGQLGNSFSSLSSIFNAVADSSTAAIMEMVSTTLQGASQIISSIMGLIAAKEGEAMASGVASAAAMPFPANIAAIASVTAAIISTFAGIISSAQKFADGGIVGGGSLYGDKILARVNSGEMILNGKQQKKLFDILDNGGAIGNGAQIQQIQWKIKGADLYGTLKNFTNIKSKSSSIKGL